jgi:spermidine synthase
VPDTDHALQHVKPFVYEGSTSKALHFSISEIQSRMRLADPHALDLEYTRLMMGFLLFHPQPREIAMIGLGGGSLAKFCHRHLPGARIEVAEINPHVIALRDEFHVPPDDARLRVLRADGAAYVRQRADCCDALLVDGFDSGGLPTRLSSQRFYDDCFAMLRPGGILVVNLYAGHARYEIHLDRIRRSFDDHVLAVVDAQCSNSIVFACKGDALEGVRPGVMREPSGLGRGAADQLLGAFARIASALKQRGGAPGS